MTEPTKVLPGDPGYNTIYQFWIANSKPLINRVSGGVYMALSTDGQIQFLLLNNETDLDNFQSTSLGGVR